MSSNHLRRNHALSAVSGFKAFKELKGPSNPDVYVLFGGVLIVPKELRYFYCFLTHDFTAVDVKYLPYIFSWRNSVSHVHFGN
ncbi:hypothetical protein Z947_4212 [Sulfitobacter geojensis]|nr:hypothetical protein Z947_4212 [Sulfitobacter geojensis]